MSIVMEEEIKRWTARRKSALVLEIIQGKATVSEASRQFDLPPSEIESWVDEGKRGLENALRAKPEDVREQYERQLKDLQEAYGEAMLELRARKKLVHRRLPGSLSRLPLRLRPDFQGSGVRRCSTGRRSRSLGAGKATGLSGSSGLKTRAGQSRSISSRHPG